VRGWGRGTLKPGGVSAWEVGLRLPGNSRATAWSGLPLISDQPSFGFLADSSGWPRFQFRAEWASFQAVRGDKSADFEGGGRRSDWSVVDHVATPRSERAASSSESYW